MRPASSPRPSAEQTAQALVLAAAVAACAVALHTSQVPGGPAIPLWSPRMLHPLVKLALAVGLPAALVQLSRIPVSQSLALGVSWPFAFLAAFPVAVLLLRPAGVPPAAIAFWNPRSLLFFAGALAAFRVSWLVARRTPVRSLLAVSAAWSTRRIALLLFAALLALYAGLTLHEDRRNMLVGDEPHYLLEMESLRRYGTVDLTRILADDDLPPGVRKVVAHRTHTSVPGKTYEVHSLGLPLLLVPWFAAGGYGGAMLFLNLLAALVVVNLFLLCVEVTGQRGWSLLVAALAGVSCPFLFYFRAVYPEMAGALALVVAYRVLRRPQPGWLALAGAGAASAFLPWLHVKFLILTVTLALIALLRHRGTQSRTAAFLAPHLPSAILLMLHFQNAYGSWLPNAQYGTGEPPLTAYVFRGMAGLFLDKDHGLLAFSPYWYLALPGFFALTRLARRDSRELLALTLPTFAIVSSHWMWWGGPCPPGRFLLPLLPLWAPGLVAGFGLHAGPIARLLAGGAVATALTLSALSLQETAALPFHKHFLRRVLLEFDAFPPLPQLFYTRADAVPPAQAAICAIWIALSLALLWRAGRGHRPCSVRTFARTIVAAGPRSLALAGLLVLGAVSAAATTGNALGPGTRSLAQLNYLLENYAKPFVRADRDPAQEAARIPARKLSAVFAANKSVSVDEKRIAERKEVPVLFGNYTSLYPVGYSVDFAPGVSSLESGTAGYLDVSAEGGREILWRREFTAAEAAAGNRIRARFRPKRIVPGVEFRCVALVPGTFTVGDIAIEVELP